MPGMLKTQWLREIQSGARNLLLHKLRSSLTMLGMVFGVSSVIAMLAVGEGASREAIDQIRKLGSNNLILDSTQPVEDETSDNTRVRMNIYGLTYHDFDRIRTTIPHVNQSCPSKSCARKVNSNPVPWISASLALPRAGSNSFAVHSWPDAS
jgi:putative ABC transport system permease protein